MKVLLTAFALISIAAHAADIGLSVIPVTIEGFTGRQSFVLGHHGTRAVLIGGRTDGLHRRQPPMAFGPEGEPQQIVVLDLESRRSWSAPVTNLPPDVLDQWTSTNACFTQADSLLYIIGGYGIASAGGGHRTHPVWSVVNVSRLIDAVVNGSEIAPLISYGSGDAFAITGGRAGFFGDTIITVGGHRFDGRYNPMNGSSFTQSYTNAVRRFTSTRTPTGHQLVLLSESVDPLNLHRRDYNVVPQMFPDGSFGYTAFSGVFQIGADLPFLSAVDIRRDTHHLVPSFEQYLAHYHCGTLPVFDERDRSMHTFFMGGIAQFRASAAGGIERNDSVPFVNTISRVTRSADGTLREFRMADTMPGLLGAGAEVMLLRGPNVTHTDVVTVPPSVRLNGERVGWVIGGIRSSAPNIFWVNDGTQSSASSFVAELRLHDGSLSTYVAPSDSQRRTAPRIDVRHTRDHIAVRAFGVSEQAVIGIYDVHGRRIDLDCSQIYDGANASMQCSSRTLTSGTYVIRISDADRTASTLFSYTR